MFSSEIESKGKTKWKYQCNDKTSVKA